MLSALLSTLAELRGQVRDPGARFVDKLLGGDGVVRSRLPAFHLPDEALLDGLEKDAQLLARDLTVLAGRRPASASRQAAVLPPGPPPTTITS